MELWLKSDCLEQIKPFEFNGTTTRRRSLFNRLKHKALTASHTLTGWSGHRCEVRSIPTQKFEGPGPSADTASGTSAPARQRRLQVGFWAPDQKIQRARYAGGPAVSALVVSQNSEWVQLHSRSWANGFSALFCAGSRHIHNAPQTSAPGADKPSGAGTPVCATSLVPIPRQGSRPGVLRMLRSHPDDRPCAFPSALMPEPFLQPVVLPGRRRNRSLLAAGGHGKGAAGTPHRCRTALFADDRHGDFPLPGPVVEVAQHHLLPGARMQAAIYHRKCF
jgi:hypothetical protein